MLIREFRNLLGTVTIASLLCAGTVMAEGDEPAETGLSDPEQSANPELPEAVAELLEAMSGVQRVEPIENGAFAIHRRMHVTGSRLPRDVTLLVAQDGTVIDWGRTPLFTRKYTRRELLATGQFDLAEGLEQLDPSIQRSRGNWR